MNDTIIQKIQKLLALAQDATGNVNETSNAAVAAQRLMLEYKITQAQIETTNGNGYASVTSWYFNDPGEDWRRLLLNGICENNFCKMIILQYQSKMRLFGKPQDIEVVQLLYKSCTYQIVLLSELNCKTQRQKDSFLRGAVEAITCRLREARKKDEEHLNSECTAIVRLADSQVNDAFRKEYPVTTGVRMNNRLDGKSFRHGFAEGKKVDLDGKKIDGGWKELGS